MKLHISKWISTSSKNSHGRIWVRFKSFSQIILHHGDVSISRMQCDLSPWISIKAILGMVENNVEGVKLVGTRDMNMDLKAKAVFDEIDYSNYNYLNKFTKPYFNDVQDIFKIRDSRNPSLQVWVDRYFSPKFMVFELTKARLGNFEHAKNQNNFLLAWWIWLAKRLWF